MRMQQNYPTKEEIGLILAEHSEKLIESMNTHTNYYEELMKDTGMQFNQVIDILQDLGSRLDEHCDKLAGAVMDYLKSHKNDHKQTLASFQTTLQKFKSRNTQENAVRPSSSTIKR